MEKAALVQYALSVALAAHGDQRRKGEAGEPYIFHPIRVYEVMKRVRPEDYELQAAALLHDVVEDTDLDYNDLIGMDFPPRTVAIVKLLTRFEGEKYFASIERVKQSESAILVKLADIEDNLKGLPPEMAGMEKRYLKARALLLAEG